MNMKTAIFSVIAIVGTAWLLWAGYQGMNGLQREHLDDDDADQVSRRESQHEQNAVRFVERHGDILSLDQILRKADAQHAGRVLESELGQKNGRYVYEVEVVDDAGRVWEMKFDARTGEVLKEKPED
jgi:uncharacterized membrane protein YkoI